MNINIDLNRLLKTIIMEEKLILDNDRPHHEILDKTSRFVDLINIAYEVDQLDYDELFNLLNNYYDPNLFTILNLNEWGYYKSIITKIVDRHVRVVAIRIDSHLVDTYKFNFTVNVDIEVIHDDGRVISDNSGLLPLSFKYDYMNMLSILIAKYLKYEDRKLLFEKIYKQILSELKLDDNIYCEHILYTYYNKVEKGDITIINKGAK